MTRPMMVMTTRISTSVKPASPPRRPACFRRLPRSLSGIPRVPPPADSADDLADRQQRRHHRHDQSADHNADDNDRRRSRNADDAVERTLQLRLVEFGNAA